MGMVISTNTASINAQRHLYTSRKELDISMERLSSGQRINSAKDDAAGLAIRGKMTSQIEGLRQAVRNSNDAISLAQTAEGAMEEITSILQRMRTLSVQAVNDTNSSNDRQALNDEVVELKAEINRIADTSVFNNTSLLKDGYTGTFQIGHQAGETINLALNDASTTTLGAVVVTSEPVIIDFDGVSSFTDHTVYSEDGFSLTTTVGTVRINDAFSAGNNAAQPSFGFGPMNSGFLLAHDSELSFSVSSVDLLEATSYPDDYSVTMVGIRSDSSTVVQTFTLDGVSGAETFEVSDDFTGLVSLQINEDSSNAHVTEIVQVDNLTVSYTSTTAIADISLLTSDNAASALTTIDQAIHDVSDQRSLLGAFQNRLSHATSNLSNMVSNTESARSVIADADYAVESSRLAKTQILQQAGTAMLAQANSMAQSVLSLLK